MGHLNSRLLWHKYAEPYFRAGTKILEIGPAGYPTYFENTLNRNHIKTEYKVLDVSYEFISGAENNPHFIKSEGEFNYPVDDNIFDIVFSDQVLAHVKYFWLWYAELIRITKPGGYIITINSYSYPPCPSPIDAWRVHSDGMLLLNEYHHLETILCKTESVEMDLYKISGKVGHYYPGASIKDPYNNNTNINLLLNKLKRYWNLVVDKIPKARALLLNPVNIAFDTITIARKK
jgi:SAM-dependent methyltransferase